MPSEKLEDINKYIAFFEKKLVPVKKGETTLKAAAEPPPPVVLAQAVPAGEPCVKKGFVSLVTALESSYLGVEIKDFILEMLKQVPQCQEAS